MRRLAVAAVGFALGAAFYLLLVDTTSEVELFVMVGVGMLAAGAFVVSREQAFTEALISPRWLAGSWRIVASVATHVVFLCREALLQLVQGKASRGVFRAVPFDAGSPAPACSEGHACSRSHDSLPEELSVRPLRR